MLLMCHVYATGLIVEQLAQSKEGPLEQQQVIFYPFMDICTALAMHKVGDYPVLLLHVLQEQMQQPRLEAPLLPQRIPITYHGQYKYCLGLCGEADNIKFVCLLPQDSNEVRVPIVCHNVLQTFRIHVQQQDLRHTVSQDNRMAERLSFGVHCTHSRNNNDCDTLSSS